MSQRKKPRTGYAYTHRKRRTRFRSHLRIGRLFVLLHLLTSEHGDTSPSASFGAFLRATNSEGQDRLAFGSAVS